MLLRSSWQTVNIGDVAHTPGALAILERVTPELEVTLWARDIDERERELIAARFPKVEIVEGMLGAEGSPGNSALQRAWEKSDVLVHGSAAGILDADLVDRWRRTGRPYGFFGVTIDPFAPFIGGDLARLAALARQLPNGFIDSRLHVLLAEAAFVYCRDSITLDFVRSQLVEHGHVRFGVDATFAFDVRDDPAADELLESFALSAGEFLAVVPRGRYAPYHELRGYDPRTLDLLKQAVTAAHLADDLGVVVDVIEGWVRRTGLPVLLGPEMRNVVELTEREILPRFDADVRPLVRHVGRFWDLETAAAVYARAAAVVSMECHSPIVALAAGTPAVYLRLESETFKGQMFADLGHDIVVEVGPDASRRVEQSLDAVFADRSTAVADVRLMTARAEGYLEEMARAVRASVAGRANPVARSEE